MPLIHASNLTDFIRLNNLYRVLGKKNMYWYYDIELQDWKPVNKVGIEQLPVVANSKQTGDKTLDAFYSTLARQNRIVHDVYMALEDRPGGDLNLFVQDTWLKPVVNIEHEPHPIFDILLTSLAGGRQEYKDLLEKCLLRKIFFPGDYTIPNLIMYGPGGMGKGLFFNLCYQIFGSNAIQTVPARTFCDRNSVICGKVVVYFDDNQLDETQSNRLKDYSAQRNIITRAEHNTPVENQNIIWWFVSHNTKETDLNLRPPVFLEGLSEKGADRRFFLIKHKAGQHLHYWIEQSPDYQMYKSSGRFSTTVEYYADREQFLHDEVAISHWLGSLVTKHGVPKINIKLETILGNDYLEAIAELEKKCECEPHDKLADLIYNSNYFNKMEVSALFKYYQEKLGGTRYRTVSPFAKFLTTYVACNDSSGIWAHGGAHPRSYWFRSRDDGLNSTRKNVVLDLDGTITTDIAPYYDEYFADNEEEEIEENPVEWDDIDGSPEEMEAVSARRRRWFDDLRVAQTAEKQLAVQFIVDQDKGFGASDYLLVALLLDAGDFATFIAFIKENYNFRLRKECVEVSDLIGWHDILSKHSADVYESKKEKYKAIWNVVHLIHWFDTRDILDQDRFLSQFITKLIEFRPKAEKDAGTKKK